MSPKKIYRELSEAYGVNIDEIRQANKEYLCKPDAFRVGMFRVWCK